MGIDYHVIDLRCILPCFKGFQQSSSDDPLSDL